MWFVRPILFWCIVRTTEFMHHWCITHLLGQFRDTTGSICNKSGLLVEGMGWGSLSNHFDSFQHLQLWHEKALVLKMYLSCNVGPARMGIGLTSYHFLRLLGVQTSNPVSKETLYFFSIQTTVTIFKPQHSTGVSHAAHWPRESNLSPQPALSTSVGFSSASLITLFIFLSAAIKSSVAFTKSAKA